MVALAAALLAPVARAADGEATDLEQRYHVVYPTYCIDPWPGPASTYGYSLISLGVIALAPHVCAALRGPVLVEMEYAKSLLTIVHEETHIGWRNPDEAATDCFALFILRAVARKYLAATPAQAQALYDLAWQAHRARPIEYQGSCAYARRDVVR